MVRMILYFKAAVIGWHITTLIKENWVSLLSDHAVYMYKFVCVCCACVYLSTVKPVVAYS